MSNQEIHRTVFRMERSADRCRSTGDFQSESIVKSAIKHASMSGSTETALALEEFLAEVLQITGRRRLAALTTLRDDYSGGTIGSDEGEAISAQAFDVAADYRNRGVTYQYGGDASRGGTTSDCSHFVHDVLQQEGFDIPYTTTGMMSSSQNFTLVSAAEAQAGDIIVQGGHMGVYTGQHDPQGHPLGVQMGNSGPANAPWGPGGWFSSPDDMRFYRPNEQN